MQSSVMYSLGSGGLMSGQFTSAVLCANPQHHAWAKKLTDVVSNVSERFREPQVQYQWHAHPGSRSGILYVHQLIREPIHEIISFKNTYYHTYRL